ncbi:hypothetical protein QJS10_CPB15g01945 [Acorus calamus]|uniref:K Homology domain-containing protein n=1 Tax=Acorus calamus TaxID=4465 RepID=A0AAV9D642_ACOCL|nr:hypothetical protein QJS10_CPB15g01945 [Acorus calamus]
MDIPIENVVEHEAEDEQEVTESLENSQPPQKQETDGDVGGAVEKRWPGWPGESVFRILVPAQKVGGIIGRKGEFIKKMCEDSRARIRILDGPPGTPERAVMITAKEEPDASLPPAINGLLMVHKRTIDGIDSEVASGAVSASTKLLVAASQAGSLIGKQGATIKSIQEASNCTVRVLGAEVSAFALQDDRVVEIQGEPSGVHKAVELIATHLRKFLVDRSVLPLYEMHMPMPKPQMEQNMPPPQHWGPPPQGFPNPGGSGFGGNPQFMPPRQHENFYPPPDLPPMDKPAHPGVSAYGREPPMGIHSSSNAQAPQPVITQVTQHMQIPLSFADAVIGTAGASISYIRRTSGATITIQETRGIPGEMTVEINGTASQVQTAQQLIQNFMAEAAGSAQNPVGPPDQGYNSYPSHGSMYQSPQTNPGHVGPPGGGYGSMYGANYGY